MFFEDVNDEEIGKRVGEIIKVNRDRIETVAYEICISSSQLRKLIKGQCAWKIEYLKDIADKYGVDVTYLLYGKVLIPKVLNDKEDYSAMINESLVALENLPRSTQDKHISETLKVLADFIINRDLQ